MSFLCYKGRWWRRIYRKMILPGFGFGQIQRVWISNMSNQQGNESKEGIRTGFQQVNWSEMSNPHFELDCQTLSAQETFFFFK